MKRILQIGLCIFLAACNHSQRNAEVNVSNKEILSFASPESIVEHKEYLYVSNVGKELKPMDFDGDGFILKCDLNGNPIERFAAKTILNAPKGIEIINNTLYVTDINRVLGFDLKSQEKVFEADLSATGGKFLNDLVQYHDELLVSVTDLGKIFIINLSTGKYRELITNSALRGPNGLFYEKSGAQLFVVEWGTGEPNGRLLQIDLSEANENVKHPVQVLSEQRGNLDGICQINASLLFSDWASGNIFQFSSSENKTTILIEDSMSGPADFSINTKGQLLIPEMLGNKLKVQ